MKHLRMKVQLGVMALLATAGLLSLGVATALWADPTSTPPPAKPTETITFKAQRIVSESTSDNTRITTISGGHAIQEDTDFYADNIVVKSTGNVHEFTCTDDNGKQVLMTDPENHLTCDKLIGYSSPRRAELTGNVKMVSTPKPKPDDKNKLASQPSTLTCDALSYDYGAKTAHATSNVKVVQKERTVWADEATYDQSVELLTMKGNVRMQNTGEGEVKSMKDADTLSVSLQTDWVDIIAKPGGAVTFELNVQQDETPKAPPAAGTTTPAPAPAVGATTTPPAPAPAPASGTTPPASAPAASTPPT